MSTNINIFERRRRNLLQLLETRYRGSQAELARAIGRSPSYIWRLLSPPEGRHAKHLGEQIARLVEQSSDLPSFWLDQDHQQARSMLSASGVSATAEAVLAPPRMTGPRAVPIYHLESLEVRPSLPPRGTVVGLVYTDTDLSLDAFAVVARGDAMSPDINAGDKVFGDPGVQARPGDIVLARAGTTVVLRQYRPAGDGSDRYELSATNHGYAPISSDRAPCLVIGVMVEHHRYRLSR